MNDNPTPPPPPEAPPRIGRLVRLPRLSGKATAACLVGFFLATGLLVPGVVRLPLWIDFEIVLGIWWLTWWIVLAVLLYRGQRLTDDHALASPRNWLTALKSGGDAKPQPKPDPLDIKKKRSQSDPWWTWLDFSGAGSGDGEGCLFLLGLILALILLFFALWFLIEIAIPAVVFLLYCLARGMLAMVVNDRHRCRGNLARSLGWSLLWATLYTAPLAGVVWAVHWLLGRPAVA